MSRTYYQKFLGALMCKISVGDSNRQLGGETLLIPRAHEIEWHPRPQRQDSWGPRESGKHSQAVEPSAPPTVLCVMIYQCLSSVGLSDFTFTFVHWRRKWQPTPVFLPGESQGRGSLVGCRLWGRTELDTTEVT